MASRIGLGGGSPSNVWHRGQVTVIDRKVLLGCVDGSFSTHSVDDRMTNVRQFKSFSKPVAQDKDNGNADLVARENHHADWIVPWLVAGKC